MPKRMPKTSPSGRGNKKAKVKNARPHHSQSLTPRSSSNTKSSPYSSNPELVRYADAWESMDNEFLKKLDVSDDDRIYLRQIQSTYKVQLTHWAEQGYGFRIMLIWDYDRLWGSFEFGFFKGVMLIDPGPAEVSDEPKTLQFTWRGKCTEVPDTLFNSPLTIGEIRVDAGLSEISGHFDAMLGVGLPNKGRCEFSGKRAFGPARVPRSLQSFINEWNEHAFWEEDETVRLPPDSTNVKLQESLVSKPSVSSFEWTAEDQQEFLGSVTGIFTVVSQAIENNWPTKADHLSIRFHIVREKNKVWGMFTLGICEGFLLLMKSPDSLEHDVPLKFRWHGREVDTGERMSGRGEVNISDNRTIQGTFYDMYGNVDFTGRRKLMPSNISGHEPWYYRSQWAEYGSGISGWR